MYTGVMIAPVVGSGDCPAWMARVPKRWAAAWCWSGMGQGYVVARPRDLRPAFRHGREAARRCALVSGTIPRVRNFHIICPLALRAPITLWRHTLLDLLKLI